MRGRFDADESLRFPFAGQVDASAGIGGQILVRFGLLLPVKIVGGRDGEFGELWQLRFADYDEPTWIGIIQRAQEHGVDHRKNRRAGADPEREGDDGDDGEAWSFDKLAKSVTE